MIFIKYYLSAIKICILNSVKDSVISLINGIFISLFNGIFISLSDWTGGFAALARRAKTA
ncbi:hypothetical protein [Saprospira grandis]|uniref:hypothetical protein n=1 Tax=Saprospira grandis TaxID=1008 RepID=UPI0002D264BF|nr:hypothetical protein [Saprospira grandis]